MTVPVKHKMKMKEIEKILESCQIAEKLRNEKVMVVAIVVGSLRIVPKNREKRLAKIKNKGKLKIILAAAPRRVLDT